MVDPVLELQHKHLKLCLLLFGLFGLVAIVSEVLWFAQMWFCKPKMCCDVLFRKKIFLSWQSFQTSHASFSNCSDTNFDISYASRCLWSLRCRSLQTVCCDAHSWEECRSEAAKTSTYTEDDASNQLSASD